MCKSSPDSTTKSKLDRYAFVVATLALIVSFSSFYFQSVRSSSKLRVIAYDIIELNGPERGVFAANVSFFNDGNRPAVVSAATFYVSVSEEDVLANDGLEHDPSEYVDLSKYYPLNPTIDIYRGAFVVHSHSIVVKAVPLQYSIWKMGFPKTGQFEMESGLHFDVAGIDGEIINNHYDGLSVSIRDGQFGGWGRRLLSFDLSL
jgi:hypothetical protein